MTAAIAHKDRLCSANTPAAFWRLLELRPSPHTWENAAREAAPGLPDAARSGGVAIDALLEQTLAEGQFGQQHWQLSGAQRLYYRVKPWLPRALTRRLRRAYRGGSLPPLGLRWPIEPRYVRFQLDVARHVLRESGVSSSPFINVWPEGHRYAFVLTHDVETAEGQARVPVMAELDASHGFRSSFNFVPQRYVIDRGLVRELRSGGFEVGVHGLNHDGHLFDNREGFQRKAQRINHHLHDLDAVGFRSPLTHRQPQWMQALDIEYDLSFFDTDPYEPIPGGTMTVWPFQLGRFIELPYTLAQDYTLTAVLGETTPRVWLQKVDFLEECHGLVLLNAHPDYLADPTTRGVYGEFLQAMHVRSGYWHALPREVARWWRDRSAATSIEELPGGVIASLRDADWSGAIVPTAPVLVGRVT